LLRQSVFGRLAGYEDVNDADRMARDPAMRWVVGGRAVHDCAASASQMGRFETEWLASEENLAALADLSGRWIDRVHGRQSPRTIVLDMDSSVSPTYGDQEGTAYNGHFACTCYHPLFVFNQFGDLERCVLRPGNVHSAHGWKEEVEPVVARYRGKFKRRYFRANAAFANPEVYEFPGGRRLQVRDQAACQPDSSREDRVSAQASCWSAAHRGPAVPRQLQLSGAKLEDTAPGGGQGRVAPGRALSARRVHRHQHDEAGGAVVAFYNQRGTAEHWIKEGKNAVKWTQLSCCSFAANAVRLQLHALAYNLANFMRTLALPEAVKQWSLTSLREKLIKIGAKVVRHGRYVIFQMAEVEVPKELFQGILRLIDGLRPRPAPA